jgi:cobalt-zinc-cadmium efflux system membrane fusion protein
MKRFVYVLGIIIFLAAVAVVSVKGEFALPVRAAIDAPRSDHDNQHASGEDHHGHDEELDDHKGHDSQKESEGHKEHEGGGHEADCDDDGICSEHRIAEAEDALCHADHIGDLMPGQGMKVRLATLEAATKAGIITSLPQEISIAEGVGFPGQAGFNRNRLARITPLASGIIRQVLVKPGANVGTDETLAEIATPEIASLKSQLISAQARRAQAKAAYLREKDLLGRGITSQSEFQKADAEYRSAKSDADQFRQQLLNFGLSPDDITELQRTGTNSPNLKVRSPFAGTVVEMETAIGESVAPGSHLFTVADLETLWIELSIPESRIYQAQIGAQVEARFDGLPGTMFKGRIFQVGASLDEHSRILKALAEVNNPGLRLKAGMFGHVRILSGVESQVLSVPADAVQSIEGDAYLFVYLEKDLFELRRVEAGAQDGGLITIRFGLSPDDRVVTNQGFALKSEVLKARLGASCADH